MLSAENAMLQGKAKGSGSSGNIAPTQAPAPKTFTPPAAEGPSRPEDDWANTRDLNDSIQALQERLKANEEKAKQLAVLSQTAKR